MMPGMIMLWAGPVVDIPAGWTLCDGNNGTPNLTDKFIVGAGDTHAPGDTGGAATHWHNIGAGGAIAAGTDFDAYTDVKSHLPPYHALAFIMKLP